MENQFLNSIETYETKVDALLKKLDDAAKMENASEVEAISKQIETLVNELKMDTIQLRTIQ
jgi:Skp family chaperone for outer membrane proteins